MIPTDFENFAPYFSHKENWGDISKLQWYHVHHLYLIRDYIGWPMIIHGSVEAGHSTTGWHPKGMATDFHFETTESLNIQARLLLNALELFNLFSFVGLGIYLDWGCPGFHLDSRGFKARWGRRSIHEGYISFENILGAI